MKKKRPPEKTGSLKNQIKENKSVFAVYLVLRLVVVAVMVHAIVLGNYENAFVCLLVLILFLIPAFLRRNFGIELPSTMQIIILVFIFASEILGELRCYYVNVPYWDKLMHTTSGFVSAAVGYSMVEFLNKDKDIPFQLSPVYLAVVAFCFSMTIGVLWEFFEFSVDFFFHADMQKDTVIHSFASVLLDPTRQNIAVVLSDITDVSVNGKSLGLGGYLDIGLYDTMQDLMVNFVGALIFSVVGFFSARRHERSKFLENLVPRAIEDETPPDSGNSQKGEDAL